MRARARARTGSADAGPRLAAWLDAGGRAAPPASEAELLARAQALAGGTLAELAARAGVTVPAHTGQGKGFAGRLVERVLGADPRGVAPGPDLAALGIEIKTVPLASGGRPRESTFVCRARLSAMDTAEWESSPVRRKLARVLWVPVEAAPEVALGARRVGRARLWSPSPDDDRALRQDWEELAGLIACGQLEYVTAHLGRFLQIRPKGPNARARGRGVDAGGAPVSTLPRGFYLRPAFTERVFALDD